MFSVINKQSNSKLVLLTGLLLVAERLHYTGKVSTVQIEYILQRQSHHEDGITFPFTEGGGGDFQVC